MPISQRSGEGGIAGEDATHIAERLLREPKGGGWVSILVSYKTYTDYWEPRPSGV